MNRLVQSSLASDPNAQQPLPVASVLFMQDAAKESLMNLVLNLIGFSYSSSSAYVLFGCIGTGTDPGARTISAGSIFFNGEIYSVPAASFTTTGSDVAVGTIIVTNPSPDPILLKDGTSTNVHNVRQIVFTAGASGSGDFDFDDLVYLSKVYSVTSNASYTTTGTYAVITGLTFTTPNDGTTRNYQLMYKAYFVQSNGAASSEADIKFRNVTTSTDYDSTSAGKANAATTDVFPMGISLLDIQSIGPNETIEVWALTSLTTSSGTLNKSKFSIVEIR